MEKREIARMRLRNQRLVAASPQRPEAVVAWFGAMQAQELAVARWSIGMRTVGLTDAAVQQALDDGRILRTHALRPTWHFLAAEDLRWIQALTGPRVHAFNGYYNRQHGLDEALAHRADAVLVEALRGGRSLTRAEIGAALAEAGLPPAVGNKLAYVVMRAELDGLIASGPVRGKQQTYALVAERAPVGRDLAGDAALAELTRRYFTSHGPATVKDFAWWSSLTLTQIRHGVALLGDELTSLEVDGLRLWYRETDSTVDLHVPAATHALQAYDEYVIAYTESRGVTNVAGLPLNLANENTTVHAVVQDGQLVALWRRKEERSEVTALVRPLRRLTARERREISAAFERYAAFAGVAVRAEFT